MIAENIKAILEEIHPAKLIVVTKKRNDGELREVYRSGQRAFGENKVQEIVAKRDRLPEDIEWHFIGHLQRNKVKFIAPFVALIHSVDSLKLAKEINKEAMKAGRIIPVLLQVYIAREETKFGFSESELIQYCAEGAFDELRHLEIRGLMGMASNVADTEQIRTEFFRLNELFDALKPSFGNSFAERSMGMSSDYPTAIECGSTMVRIGSRVFD